MQTYIIKSFQRTDGAVFERQETGTNSGGYVNRAIPTEVKRLNDFICDGNFIIHSVIRQESITNPERNPLFTIGDRITFAGAGMNIINIIGIKITLSDVILLTNQLPTPHNTIRLINAAKYIEPVTQVTTRRAPVKRVAATTPGTTTTTRRTTPFNEVEDIIIRDNPRTIKLEATLKATATRLGLEEWLKRFFVDYNMHRATLFADDGTQQTEAARRRSLGDIYMICKYYFPNCTLAEVLRLLYITLPTEITRGFRSSYCNTINKRVWYYDENRDNIVADKTRNDEFGKPHRFYIDNLA